MSEARDVGPPIVRLPDMSAPVAARRCRVRAWAGRRGLPPAQALAAPRRYGQVSRVVGLSVTVSGLTARIGDLLQLGTDGEPTMAEVVAVDGTVCTCLPLGEMTGIGNGVRAVSTGSPLQISVGDALRGRVLDGLGQPLDAGPHS